MGPSVVLGLADEVDVAPEDSTVLLLGVTLAINDDRLAPGDTDSVMDAELEAGPVAELEKEPDAELEVELEDDSEVDRVLETKLPRDS